jgi:hypothetical protein
MVSSNTFRRTEALSLRRKERGVRKVYANLGMAVALQVALSISTAAVAEEIVPSSEAKYALREYEHACSEEGGRLWGASLCGPMLVVDPVTRVALANVVDNGASLQAREGFFVGVLPDEVGLANTAFEWSGTEWAMVLLPLPEDEKALRALLLHESWHRLQDDLALPMRACDNNHLENTWARIWMRLEWRALIHALKVEDQSLAALEDALQFRKQRHDLFPGSAQQEACLELNEGLAEYTGLRAALGEEAVCAVIQKLEAADERERFVRSFAYFSGPAYGLLLDNLSPGWRDELGLRKDLAHLAAQALPNWTPDVSSVEERAEVYGYREIRDHEQRLEHERSRRLATLRERLVDHPGLVVPLEDMEMEFDPNKVVGLAPHGTVYLTLTIRDSWGRLKATQGALIASDFGSLAVPGNLVVVEQRVVVGDSWRLELADGWELEANDVGPAVVIRQGSSKSTSKNAKGS